MSIKSTLNRLFNTQTPHDAGSSDSGNGRLRDPELGALDSFRLALTDAAEKFARKEIASLNRIKGWRWNLTGIELVIKSGNPQQVAELKRKPGKALVSVAKIAIDESENFAEMFITNNLHGVTVETEVDPEASDWVDVIGVYGNDPVPYTFVFLGELVDQPVSKTSGHQSPAQATTETPLLMGAEENDDNDVIHLTSKSFWLQDVPHPYGSSHKVSLKLSDLPVTFGRAPVGVTPLPWSLKDGFIPLYGNPHISARHFTLSLDADGQLCITDHSTNGSWIDDDFSIEGLPTTPEQLQKDTPYVITFGEDGALVYLTQADGKSFITLFSKNLNRRQPKPSTRPSTSGTTETALWPFDETNKETNLSGPSKARVEPIFTASPETNLGDGFGSVPTDLTGTTAGEPSPVPSTSPAASPKTLAVLRVRFANGSETTQAIHSLPVDIGREGLGDIPEACNKVSRSHLRLQAMQGKNAVQVNHIAHTRNGTYSQGGHAQDELFVWPIANANSSNDGWLILGEPRLSKASVQVRLEKFA